MKIILRYPAALLIVLLSLLSQACSGNKKPGEITAGTIITADLEASIGKGNIVDLSSVVSEIEYIPLETSETSLVGNVLNIYFENRMFFLSMEHVKNLQIFDIKGNHICYFNRSGRGPEEYSMAINADILPGTGNIAITQYNRNVNVYDPSGKFLNEFKIPSDNRFKVEPVIFVNDSTCAGIIFESYREKTEYVAVIFAPGDTVFKFHFPAPYFQTKEPDYNFRLSKPKSKTLRFFKPIGAGTIMYRYNGQARFFFYSNDTIFSVNADKKIETPYVIKFGKTRPESIVGVSPCKYAEIIGPLLESDDFLFLYIQLYDNAHESFENEVMLSDGKIYRYKETSCYALLNKKTGYFTLLNQPEKGVLGLREDILNGPPFWPKYLSSTG
ncbi:MAG: 6-bladed beta-propeller, partial [Bacteroidales bacterium]|nr:6-bladed beta-propeller [Bacteroidales bacterium]